MAVRHDQEGNPVAYARYYMRIFIYEHVSAGGLGPDVPASLLREGEAMRTAVTVDFRRVPGVELVDCARAAEFSLIIAPEFDDHLRRLSAEALAAGSRLLGPSPGAIAFTADKLRLAQFWHERGVPHPWTGLVGAASRFPWVLKPRHGAGSQATFLIRDETDKVAALGAVDWDGEMLAQEYVAGQAASVALLIGPAQTTPLAPARQLLSSDGRFHYRGGVLPLPPPFAERATRLALQAVAGVGGLAGYVGVDLVLGDDGRDFAIEINPRLTTSYLGLRQLCQQNLAELMLRCALGHPLALPTWHNGEVHFDPRDCEPLPNVGRRGTLDA